MPIHPLPQFEADLKEHLKEQADREAYQRLNAPSSIVVRFGYLKMVGEFPYSGEAKPGCGSKLVVRTHRGTELGEMLTSTCANSGCSKSVSRKQMLEYIENSGGRQYPFYDRGRVLRIATAEDLSEQERIEQRKNELRLTARRLVEASALPMKIIEAEPLLGGERVVVYFSADDRVDFRDLVHDLQREVGAKVELRQIGARDEARITADYERCGQYCCCKNFLKVLKPVSMKSAKVQKATLDPLKISGRCGRLMCCLRYEDETYEQLRRNLPHRKSRVGTPDGDGTVESTQILTQLALVRLDDGTEGAYPIENLTEPESRTPPEPGARSPAAKTAVGTAAKTTSKPTKPATTPAPKRARSKPTDGPSDRPRRERTGPRADAFSPATQTPEISGDGGVDQPPKKRRRKRRPRREDGAGHAPHKSPSDTNTTRTATDKPSDQGDGERSSAPPPAAPGALGSASGSGAKKKRRRRRRRSGGGGGGGATDRGGD